MAAPTINNHQYTSGNVLDTTSPVALSNYQVSAGSNQKLLVFIAAEDDTVTISGVTFGSDTLTLAASMQDTYQRVWIYYCDSPTQQTADISVAFATAALGRWCIGACYANGAATGAPDSDTGTAGTIGQNTDETLTITTSVDDCVLLGIWNHLTEGTTWSSTGDTVVWQSSGESISVALVSAAAATAGSNDVSAQSDTGRTRNASAAIAIAPAAAPPSGNPWHYYAQQ